MPGLREAGEPKPDGLDRLSRINIMPPGSTADKDGAM
jgi:hypothetical protein